MADYTAPPSEGGGYPPIHFPEPDTRLAEASLALSREQFDWQKQQAEERKQNIADAMGTVRGIFEGRANSPVWGADPLGRTDADGNVRQNRYANIYDQLRRESQMLNMSQLRDTRDDAQQDLKFALARAGTTYGSAGSDKNRQLAEAMATGTGRVQQFARAQQDQFRAQDEQLRSSLMGLAASGAIGGEIRSHANSALQGVNGNAIYMPGVENTFQGLSTGIGGANASNPIPGGRPQYSGGF